jgi:hypothetical protein
MWKTRAGEGEDGQATVELVAVLPVLGLVLVLAWQAVVAGQTWWLAGAAAREAARASALGDDPAVAARRVLPQGARVDAKPAPDGSVRIKLAIPPVVPGLRIGSVTTRARMEPQS